MTGESFQSDSGDPTKAEFVFSYSHTRHGHGLPEGSCGIRLVIYRRDEDGRRVQSGKWEDLKVGHLSEVVPGNHHCAFTAFGDDANFDGESFPPWSTIVDEKGEVVWTGKLPWGDSTWIEDDGRELLWVLDQSAMKLMTPDGTPVWSRDEQGTFYGTFFSPDRRYAFRYMDENPQRGVIHGWEERKTWSFVLPYESEKAQKSFLGLNTKGELVIRVNRRIYSVSREGVAHQEAELPLYARRHPAEETMRPGIHFDVGYNYGRLHRYDYATLVPTGHDHPRPAIRFNIDDFEGEESLDEGKTWHPKSIKVNGDPQPGEAKTPQ